METNKQTSECKSCKQKGPSNLQIGSIILGFYVLFSSIYGTIKIAEYLISIFK